VVISSEKLWQSRANMRCDVGRHEAHLSFQRAAVARKTFNPATQTCGFWGARFWPYADAASIIYCIFTILDGPSNQKTLGILQNLLAEPQLRHG
jgi:hypothetical protein